MLLCIISSLNSLVFVCIINSLNDHSHTFQLLTCEEELEVSRQHRSRRRHSSSSSGGDTGRGSDDGDEEHEEQENKSLNSSQQIIQSIMDGVSALDLDHVPLADKSRALLMAARRGLAECVTWLLDAGADPNAEDDFAYTPLMYMSAQGLDACMLAMLEQSNAGGGGVSSSVSRCCKVNKRTDSQQTALHLAAGKGHEGCVRILLQHGALVNAADDWGETPLLLAVTSGSTQTVKLLLNNGARMDMMDLRGDDAFMHAAKKGDVDIVRLLLEYGAQPNRSFKTSALHMASSFGHEHVVQVLLEAGAEANMRDIHGYLPIQLATQTDQWRVVRCLLEHDKQHGEHLNIALAASAFWNATKSVEVLLDYGASPHAVDKHGIPALFLALAQNNRDMVIRLIKHNCNVNRAVRKVYFFNTEFEQVCSAIRAECITPLHIACLRGYRNLVQILVVAGARTEAFKQLHDGGLLPDVIQHDEELLEWLLPQCLTSAPLPLRQQCRTAIRATVSDADRIRSLCLPPLLLDFLTFNDLIHIK